MAVGLTLFVEEFNLEHSVGHGLPNDTFYFDDIFFRQACLLYTSLTKLLRQKPALRKKSARISAPVLLTSRAPLTIPS